MRARHTGPVPVRRAARLLRRLGHQFLRSPALTRSTMTARGAGAAAAISTAGRAAHARRPALVDHGGARGAPERRGRRERQRGHDLDPDARIDHIIQLSTACAERHGGAADFLCQQRRDEAVLFCHDVVPIGCRGQQLAPIDHMRIAALKFDDPSNFSTPAPEAKASRTRAWADRSSCSIPAAISIRAASKTERSRRHVDRVLSTSRCIRSLPARCPRRGRVERSYP